MRNSILATLFCASSLWAGIPAGGEEVVVAPTSDKVVVKDCVYHLQVTTDRLTLTSQPLPGMQVRGSGEFGKPKDAELKFSLPEKARVVALSLAKLDHKNLMAVVQLESGPITEFHCLTFIAPSGGHVHEKFAFHQARFHTTTEALEVLALDGRNGTVFIVLGEMKDDGEDFVTEGMFYFSGCPWPPSDGQVSPFRVTAIKPRGE